MKILEERGVVKVRAGRGTLTVAPTPERVKSALLRLFRDQPIPTLTEMEHMIELREVLEETVAGLAAVRANEKDLQQISNALSDMAATGRSAEEPSQPISNSPFRCRSLPLTAFFEMVLEPLTHVFVQQIKLTDSYTVGVDLHRSVYEKIAKGDPIGARQAVRRLMQSTRNHVKTALKMLASDEA